MDEELNLNDENQQRETANPQATIEGAESEPKERLSEKIENDEPGTNDIPQRRPQNSSVSAMNEDKVHKITMFADDLEQLNEMSSAQGPHSYCTLDEDIEFEEDEEKDGYGRFSYKRLSLFNPKDQLAIELKTEDIAIKLSKLPRLDPPVEEQTSMERVFNLQMMADVSLSSLDSSESFDEAAIHESIAEKESKRELNFFQKLANVPDVSEIRSDSLDITDYVPRHYKETTKTVYGKFVHPLTGGSLTETAVEYTVKEEEVADEALAEEIEEEEEESDFSEVEFQDFDVLFSEDKAVPQQKVVVKENEELMDIFAAGVTQVYDEEVVDNDVVPETYKAEKAVELFLEGLINCVLEYFEQREGDKYLREKLDKKKLFREIDVAIKEFSIEQRVQSFLNRKIETYYRRKRQLRNLIPERPEVLAAEREKYKDSLENLNRLLGRETFTFAQTTSKIEALFKECGEAEQLSKTERRNLNDLVKKSLKRDNMPKLDAIIDKELEHIAAVSAEISKVRAVFISRQHMLGTLKAQLNEIENIGDGLRVADYEAIERQTLRLEKKIEEHNSDLSRFYTRFRNTIHSMAHSKIRNEMLVNSVKQQVRRLSDLDESQNMCHQAVLELKKQRQNIKRAISDLSFQSGLLDKPAILLDYDLTVELVEKKRSEVEILRETLKNAEEKLKRVEQLN